MISTNWQKPALSRREVEKPLKQKRVAALPEEPPPFQPQLSPLSWYEEMIHMRNQQALARNDAMLAPYAAMFTARRNNLYHQR